MKPSSTAETVRWPRAAVARCLPFFIYMAFLALNEVLQRLGWSAADTRALYAVRVGAVVAALAYFWRDYDELHRWDLKLLPTLAAVATGIVVLLLWLSLGADWMTVGTAGGFDARGADGRLDLPLVAVRIAGAALVVPVMEELFWRSFLMRWLDNPRFATILPQAVSLRAIAISSVLFGIEHNLWLAGIVAGLAYALLYRWQRSLWSAVLAHAVTNGLLGAFVVFTGSWQYW